ncbi:TonB family protein [Colwelliaceae bacterium 6441]
MIDLFVSWLMPLTVMLSVFLVFHSLVLAKLGPKKTYLTWLFLPLGLLFYSLPLSWQSSSHIANDTIQQYLVQPTHHLQQQLSLEWLVVCWMLMTTLMLSYWLVSHLRFLKHVKLSVTNKAELVIKVPSKLAVFESAHAFSPMLIGIFKQKLLLPEDFTTLYNTEQQMLILEHEICHFDRNDIYWNLVAIVLLAVFWFHPLAWLAYFRFRRDQEISCDDIVLARKQSHQRINYSRALLVAAESTPPLAFAQLSFKKYGDKEIMFERIEQIKSPTRASKVSLVIASLFSITLLSGLSYAGNIGFKDAVSDSDSQAKKHRIPPKGKMSVKPIIRVQPKYPLKAAKEKIEGAVVLKFDINTEGNVKNVEVMKGVPAYVFDRVAVAALKKWKYDAKGQAHKNQLVQLDFRMDENSSFKDVNLIEKIKVTQ